jgi:hypothetical protein
LVAGGGDGGLGTDFGDDDAPTTDVGGVCGLRTDFRDDDAPALPLMSEEFVVLEQILEMMMPLPLPLMAEEFVTCCCHYC